MPKPPMIENKELFKMVDDYFSNKRFKSKVKYADIARYVQQNGYPKYQVDYIRHNPEVKAYIDKCKSEEEEFVTTLVTYKSLDVESFIRDNATKAKMTSALTDLSNYYKKVSDAAVSYIKEGREKDSKINRITKALKEQDSEIERLRNSVVKLKEEKQFLQQQIEGYKRIVDEYVYPEIANKLLSESNAVTLPSEHIVNEPKIIEPDNTIPLTKFLLRRFEGEEDENS